MNARSPSRTDLKRCGLLYYTTNFILAEIHALLLRRLGRDIALAVLRSLLTSRTARSRVTQADEDRALAIISQYGDKEWSFTDATSFAVMERLGISYAFAFDNDYTQYGFTRVTPEVLLQM